MEFLEKHTTLDKDNLTIEMTESGKENMTVRVTSGIEIGDIMSTVDKIDFRVSKEKFFDRPIYVQAIR